MKVMQGLEIDPSRSETGLGPAEPSDEWLATATRAGDSSACAILVRRYLRRAMAVAIEYTKRRADAEDVVQEAFARMVSRLGTFDDSRPFAPWFYTLVRNTARNAASHGRRREHDGLSLQHASASPGPLEDAARSELRARIAESVDRLSPMQAACFRLCLVEGLSSAEAGAALGIAESTVRVHVLQARRTLQPLLREWRNEDGA